MCLRDQGKLQRISTCWERDDSGARETLNFRQFLVPISIWEGSVTEILWQAVPLPGNIFITQKLFLAISHPLQTALIASKIIMQWLPNLIGPLAEEALKGPVSGHPKTKLIAWRFVCPRGTAQASHTVSASQRGGGNGGFLVKHLQGILGPVYSQLQG